MTCINPLRDPQRALPCGSLRVWSGLNGAFPDAPEHVTAVQYQRLLECDAFTLPSESLRTSLLASFLTWFHPSKPILCPNEIVRLSNLAKGGAVQSSPLLVYAVLCVAADSAPLRDLCNEGYHTRDAARLAFAKKAWVSVVCLILATLRG